MPSRDDAYLCHQQTRWLRHDAARWVRPDAARFLRPGTRVEDVYPALALKYSPHQPRVPAGNGIESGRWTNGSSSGRPRVYIYGTDPDSAEPGDAGSGESPFGVSWPMGSADVGDISSEIEKLDLFGLKPRERNTGGVQLAGDPPDGLGGPQEIPPELPDQKPSQSWQTTAVLRAAANWLMRKGPAVESFVATMNGIDWLRDYEDVIQAARDPAKTLEELQSDLSPRPGYDRHHIVEKTAAQHWGFTKDDTESPDNLVMIPRLKHYQITGWYATPNDKYARLSPREYLRDKDWDERRRVGLDALILFKVLKP